MCQYMIINCVFTRFFVSFCYKWKKFLIHNFAGYSHVEEIDNNNLNQISANHDFICSRIWCKIILEGKYQSISLDIFLYLEELDVNPKSCWFYSDILTLAKYGRISRNMKIKNVKVFEVCQINHVVTPAYKKRLGSD